MLVFHAYFYWGFLIFKGLTARLLYKSFGVKGLTYHFSSNQELGLPHSLKLSLTALKHDD
jgi:hypothetical protein